MVPWLSYFPPADGLPGDPLTDSNRSTPTSYLLRAVNRRFTPPSKPTPWTGVHDTLEYGPTTMQDEDAFGLSPELLSLLPLREGIQMDENCLVLNVWTPAVNDNGKRPVMFWCHGGAFIAGWGSSPWYDGTNLCRKGDVVVVTVNHRLGAFGHLHLDDLGGDEFASSGNAGMLVGFRAGFDACNCY